MVLLKCEYIHEYRNRGHLKWRGLWIILKGHVGARLEVLNKTMMTFRTPDFVFEALAVNGGSSALGFKNVLMVRADEI
jgi:hypothetical protein